MGSTLNFNGFKITIFQYIICEPFRSWKEGLVKLDVNLWEIWRKFKCRRSASGPSWSLDPTRGPPSAALAKIVPRIRPRGVPDPGYALESPWPKTHFFLQICTFWHPLTMYARTLPGPEKQSQLRDFFTRMISSSKWSGLREIFVFFYVTSNNVNDFFP